MLDFDEFFFRLTKEDMRTIFHEASMLKRDIELLNVDVNGQPVDQVTRKSFAVAFALLRRYHDFRASSAHSTTE
jgi:hypothetical protein